MNAGNIGIWWSIDIWHIGTITATRYLGLLIGGTPRVVIHLLQSILLFLFAFENGFEILPTGIVLLIATNFAIRRDPSLRIFQFRQCLVNISAKLFLVVIDFDLQKMGFRLEFGLIGRHGRRFGSIDNHILPGFLGIASLFVRKGRCPCFSRLLLFLIAPTDLVMQSGNFALGLEEGRSEGFRQRIRSRKKVRTRRERRNVIVKFHPKLVLTGRGFAVNEEDFRLEFGLVRDFAGRTPQDLRCPLVLQ